MILILNFYLNCMQSGKVIVSLVNWYFFTIFYIKITRPKLKEQKKIEITFIRLLLVERDAKSNKYYITLQQE